MAHESLFGLMIKTLVGPHAHTHPVRGPSTPRHRGVGSESYLSPSKGSPSAPKFIDFPEANLTRNPSSVSRILLNTSQVPNPLPMRSPPKRPPEEPGHCGGRCPCGNRVGDGPGGV